MTPLSRAATTEAGTADRPALPAGSAPANPDGAVVMRARLPGATAYLTTPAIQVELDCAGPQSADAAAPTTEGRGCTCTAQPRLHAAPWLALALAALFLRRRR